VRDVVCRVCGTPKPATPLPGTLGVCELCAVVSIVDMEGEWRALNTDDIDDVVDFFDIDPRITRNPTHFLTVVRRCIEHEPCKSVIYA